MNACKKCLIEKQESEFVKNATCKGGRSSTCRSCHAIAKKVYAKTDNAKRLKVVWARSEAGLDSAKKSNAKPARLQAINQNVKRWNKENPVKKGAQNKVAMAITSGALVAGCCEDCGETKAQAHHDDYSKPLTVRWLCAYHHSQWHKLNGEGINGKLDELG